MPWGEQVTDNNVKLLIGTQKKISSIVSYYVCPFIFEKPVGPRRKITFCRGNYIGHQFYGYNLFHLSACRDAGSHAQKYYLFWCWMYHKRNVSLHLLDQKRFRIPEYIKIIQAHFYIFW